MSKLKDYVKNMPAEDVETIKQHGCEGGIQGLCYIFETNDLYNTMQQDVWDTIVRYDDETCSRVLVDAVKKSDSQETFANYLMWAAIEITVAELDIESQNE